ncbi:MAG TPA: N-acetylglucosamine-6-phosphate deacetylase, partial [Bryobacterales bacterium]|nr:N-acetylglucosamine-6-phosphate deacetylase [Bryobacterales bacterium]
SGRPVEIEVAGGRIAAVRESPGGGSAGGASEPDAGGVWVAPGFIDLQVNGFAGVDYNSPETTLDDIARSIRAMRSAGVTRFFPTVITGSRENMLAALRNLARAAGQLDEGASIAGVHVEGPFLSPDDGPRGAHPRQHVRPPDGGEYRRMQEAAGGAIRLFTLAPEWPGATALIELLVKDGVVASIGHTAAAPEQIRDAIRAGATMSTHLGNGAHGVLPRHPNYIWEQMAADELYAGLIVDGIHLPPSFVKCAVRAKGLERSVLVTDATACAGSAPGRYRLGDVDVELTADNRVQIVGTRTLAGSALRMDQGVENLMRFAGLSLLDALRMATVNPARAVSLTGRTGFLQPGDTADLVLFSFHPQTGHIGIESTMVAAH